MKYQFITEIPSLSPSDASQELGSLAIVWKNQSERLKESENLRQFNEQLAREWAIETGIIENLYSIERGVTQILIERGLDETYIPHGKTDKPVEEVMALVRSQRNALDGLFTFVKDNKPFTQHYIRALHAELTKCQRSTEAVGPDGHMQNIPLIHGAWKINPNNPTRPDGEIHEYCPPLHVEEEMNNLVNWFNNRDTNIPTEIIAAWLHHRFTQIHPFQDGNGRVARSLASMVFIKYGLFPIVVVREQRGSYIDALEKADSGDLQPLVDMLCFIQIKSIKQALSLSEEILKHPRKNAEDAILDMAFSQLVETRKQREDSAIKLLERLQKAVNEEFKRIEKNAMKKIQQKGIKFTATTEMNNDQNDHWYRWEIVKTAKKMDYYANTRDFRRWIRLQFTTNEHKADIVLSFHGLGTYFTGAMAVSAFIVFRFSNLDEESYPSHYEPLSEVMFSYTHNDNEVNVEERFRRWLSNIVIAGLEAWRKHL